MARIELASCSAHLPSVKQYQPYLYGLQSTLSIAKSRLNIGMKHMHHIVPRHMGGTDNPSNLVELTPAEHAEAHRILYETYGHWQDYVAWQGLAKLSKKEDLVKIRLSESGKLGATISNKDGGWRKKNIQLALQVADAHRERMKTWHRSRLQNGVSNPNAKTYEITCPSGQVIKVTSLKAWCNDTGISYNTFYNQCIGRMKTHKGYSARQI